MPSAENSPPRAKTPSEPPVRLRRSPHPYKGMIAICSDIDGTNIDAFRAIHRYLNTLGKTAIGRGVGLDIADSMWFYKMRGSPDLAFFRGHSWKRPSAVAQEIIHYAKSGWIDTLHTYGNFNLGARRVVEFTREHAVAALAVSQQSGISFRVWANHGDRNNHQNIGRSNDAQGDRPDSPAYHADLIRRHGIEFLWGTGRSDPPGGPSVIEHRRLNDGQPMFFFDRHHWRKDYPDAAALAETYRLNHVIDRNGNSFLQVWHPQALPFQLSEPMLQQIAEEGRLCIFGQHLGYRWKPPGFEPRVAEVFRRLRDYQDQGLILVARTSRLLHYNRVREFLKFSVVAEEQKLTLNIEAVDDPVRGYWVPGIEDLRGIGFETASGVEVELCLRGKPFKQDELTSASAGGVATIGIRWFAPAFEDRTHPFLARERSTEVGPRV